MNKNSLFITSDWHLHLGGEEDQELIDSIYREFNVYYGTCADNNDYIGFMVCGDIFDRMASFNIDTVSLVIQLFNKILDLDPKIKIFLLVGNHDAITKDRTVSLLKFLKDIPRVYIGRYILFSPLKGLMPILEWGDFSTVLEKYGGTDSILFIHEDIQNATFNNSGLTSKVGIDESSITKNFKWTISGHYHLPKITTTEITEITELSQNNQVRDGKILTQGITYLGASRQLSINDEGSQPIILYVDILQEHFDKSYIVYCTYKNFITKCRKYRRIMIANLDNLPSDMTNEVIYVTDNLSEEQKAKFKEVLLNKNVDNVVFHGPKDMMGSKLVDTREYDIKDMDNLVINSLVNSQIDRIHREGLDINSLRQVGLYYLSTTKADIKLESTLELINKELSKIRENITLDTTS